MNNEMNEDQIREAHDLVNELEDAVDQLDYFAVRHDDLFNGDIYRVREEIKNMRKQLL